MNGKNLVGINQNCPSCRVPWDQHMGIAGTCAKLQAARRALALIHTWAQFGGDRFTQENVFNIVADALEASAPNQGTQTWVKFTADTKEDGR